MLLESGSAYDILGVEFPSSSVQPCNVTTAGCLAVTTCWQVLELPVRLRRRFGDGEKLENRGGEKWWVDQLICYV